MSITNRIFLDSSVFVESAKGNHLDYFAAVTNTTSHFCFINDIVCSESWYLFVGIVGGASPLAIKEKRGIANCIFESEKLFSFYKDYIVLSSSDKIVEHALHLMRVYNLLPNDALILSTCLANEILFLASHDKDFQTACAALGLTLITIENHREIFSTNQ